MPRSRVPVKIEPSGQRALLSGDNSTLPLIEFLENPEQVRPGDRVVSAGDGGVFPAGILVGQLAQGSDQRLRVLLAADYERLDFLRVLRGHPAEQLQDVGALIPPPPEVGSEEETSAPLSAPAAEQRPSGDG